MAKPTTFRLKSHHTDGVNTIADETSIFAEDYAPHSPHSHTSACCAMDASSGYADGPGGDDGFFSNFATKDRASRAVGVPGGDIDDPGGGTTNDWGYFNNLITSASTSSKASASYVFSSFTTRVSLLLILLNAQTRTTLLDPYYTQFLSVKL